MTSTAPADPGGWMPASLATHAKVALNRQITRDLSQRIRNGELPAATELPSEAELAARYGVNRLTVRHALGDLARQGLIVTARGRRASVASPPVRYRLDQAAGASLSSAMGEQGLDVDHDVGSITTARASEAPLPLDGTARCVRYDYRRFVDRTPWSVSSTWVASDVAPRNWDGQRPILDEVARAHDLQIRRALRAFAAVPASLDDAEALDVPVGAPLLRVTGTSVDQTGRAVAVVRHRVLGDRAEYVLDLTDHL